MSKELVKACPFAGSHHPFKKECCIVNVDSSGDVGTHHVCYWYEQRSEKYCFYCFGVAPPTEIIDYRKKLDSDKSMYSTHVIQDINDTNCSE